MKVTWNELVIEGTPQEIQSFMLMCNMLPVEQPEKKESNASDIPEWRQNLYRELLHKSYYGKLFAQSAVRGS
ncbi:MAG: hypothetical protein ACM32O_20090 [Clostridia bacterium]